MANNVSVKVSADIVDLRAKFAIARAEAQGFQKELNNLARQASQVGPPTQGLQGDLLAAAEASAAAQSKVSAISAEIRNFGGAAEESGRASHGALRYYRELFDEFSSGRTKYIPSTLATLLTQFYGISGATLLAGGAIVGLVGGLAYLAYETAEASRQLDNLAEAFALTGREAQYSRDQVDYQLSFFKQLPGVSSAAAEGFVKFASANASVNNYIANQVGQLLPAFTQAYGEKAPEAAGKLAEALSNLTVEGFRKLNEEMLNLPPAEYEQVLHLIQIGQTAQAIDIILQELSRRTGNYIKSLGVQFNDTEQQIKSTEDALAGLKNNPMASMYGGPQEITALANRLADLKKHLADIRDLEHQRSSEGADRAYNQQVDAAQKLNEHLDERGRLTRQVTQYENDLVQAEKRHDSTGVATFTEALANARKELAQYDQQQAHKGSGFSNSGEQLIAQARATVAQINAAENVGGAQRIAEIENVYRTVLQSGRLNAAQRLQVEQELNREITQANRQAERDRQQIEQDDLRTKVELARIAFQDKKAELDQEVAAGRITRGQELQTLIAYLKQVESLQLQAVNDQEKNYEKDSVNFARAENQKKVIAAQTKSEIERLSAELTQFQEKQEFDLTRSISTGERELVRGIISGRQTLVSALANFAERILEDWVDSLVEQEAQSLLSGTIISAGSKADAAAQIPAYTGIAAMKAASSVADVPIAGPALAAAAAAQMTSLGASELALASAARGQWQVPYDGQLTMLHLDEMVLPASVASPMRSAVTALASGGSPGGGFGGDVHVHFALSAIDTQTGIQFIQKNVTAIARSVSNELTRNPSLRPAY